MIDWLLVNGVESFVEGTLECDAIEDQERPRKDEYERLGGDFLPVSVWRYSRDSLLELEGNLRRDFGGEIDIELVDHETVVWMEGWKESFKAFATRAFHVRPPWDSDPVPSGRTVLTIEPGMAFGTGQHATTRLCLGALEMIDAWHGPPKARRQVLDVGTGTGILAIGARLLGYGEALGTDIDSDAIMAAEENARLNNVVLSWRVGSVPATGAYDVVFANILAVTLLRIMDDLARVTAPGGFAVLSGLLAEEIAEISERALGAGLVVREALTRDDWACLVCERRSEDPANGAASGPEGQGHP